MSFDFGVALAASLAVGATICLAKVSLAPRLAVLFAYAGTFVGVFYSSMQPWGSAYGALAVAAVLALGIRMLVPSRGRALASVVLFGLLVAFFSGGQGSAQRFSSFLTGIPWLSPEAVEAIVIGVRKSIHLFFYASLAIFGTLVARGRSPWPILAALLWAIAHAVFDETRQMGVLGRTGSWWDVLLDTCGMAAGLGWLLWRNRRQQELNNKASDS